MKKLFLGLIVVLMLFTGCSQRKTGALSVAVFVPGVCDNNSPTYLMLVQGAKDAVEEYNQGKAENEQAQIYVMEAGPDQSEWGNKLLALTAEQKYDVIVSSNSSLPELALPILQKFPAQKYILLDAEYEGNSNIYTACYNQFEQSYLTGVIAGLMSKSHKVALIAAQEYPVMNNTIRPFFEKGAKRVEKSTSVEFRIVGNWYDGVKGAEIADAVISNGVDVILPICGGASQGVISSSVNHGTYVTWFDSNGFEKAPGTIISSSVMKQRELSKISVAAFLNEKTKWGTADSYGIKDGFVDFVQDDPLYISTVPESVRLYMSDLITDIKNGKVVLSKDKVIE